MCGNTLHFAIFFDPQKIIKLQNTIITTIFLVIQSCSTYHTGQTGGQKRQIDPHSQTKYCNPHCSCAVMVVYKWKNHFSEMKGDVGMSLHEKEGEQEDA